VQIGKRLPVEGLSPLKLLVRHGGLVTKVRGRKDYDYGLASGEQKLQYTESAAADRLNLE